jgi:tRNA (guanosine-2'-O-)-methyltransferase
LTEARQKRIEEVLSKRQNNITVILENVYDPHNIMAVMRTADAIGCSEIYVVKTVLPTHPKWGKNSSRGAIKWLQIHYYEDIETCIDAIKKKYNKIYAAQLSPTSQNLYDLDLTESVALAFGNEAKGLSKKLIEQCDGDFIIPQYGMIQSLNISVACAISLYEAMRQKTNAGHYQKSILTELEKASLLKFWSVDKS